MVLPLIIAGLAIGLVEAVSNDRSTDKSDKSCNSQPKSRFENSSCNSGGALRTSNGEIINNAGNIPGLTIGQNSVGFTNDDRYYYDDGSGYHPGDEAAPQGGSDANLQVHVAPQYRDRLMAAFEVIDGCGGWEEFTSYPIIFTSDDSSPYCEPGVGAHTDGENMNLCSCSWELPDSDLAFVMLHEWWHIHCRQRGLAYTGDPEERDCDMYALGVLHRGGLTTQEFATKFVKPGD